MDIEKKKRLEKKLTIGFQVFAVIGLIVIGFYLGKSFKARKENKEKKEQEQETIKDFGTKLEEFSIEGEKYSVIVDGKNIDIENKNGGVYLNNKKVNYAHAMGGFVLDKTLILSAAGQFGLNIIFFNKDLEEIPFDSSNWAFDELKLVDGKIVATASRYNDTMGCRLINRFEICECDNLEKGELLKNHKEELEVLKEEVINGTLRLSYNGKEIKTEIQNGQTVYDIYGKDIDGIESRYCLRTNN